MGGDAPFAAVLAGGDRRSIGRADAVVGVLERQPGRFGELWACLGDADAVVRMRAADALEKFSRGHAQAFAPWKADLLAGGLEDGSAEVRWHLLAITARLELTDDEAERFGCVLERCLREDASRIVKVAALQAASALTSGAGAAARFERMLAFALASPWPSVRARAERLRGAG